MKALIQKMVCAISPKCIKGAKDCLFKIIPGSQARRLHKQTPDIEMILIQSPIIRAESVSIQNTTCVTQPL